MFVKGIVEDPAEIEVEGDDESVAVDEKSAVVLNDHVDDFEGNDNVAPLRWDVAAVSVGVNELVGVNGAVRVLFGFCVMDSENNEADLEANSNENVGVWDALTSSVPVRPDPLFVVEGMLESLVVGESVNVDVLSEDDGSEDCVWEILFVEDN